ncbi:MAG TPA: hypothetical protein VMA86_05605 [Acetobacteraceae bacterium]|nr:hypothetical protein [Acetobacteraceae bacterium]
MLKSDEIRPTTISATEAESTASTEPTEARTTSAAVDSVRGSTKDAGRVHFGAGMMRF